MSHTNLAFVDIGSSNICSIIASLNGRTVHVLGAGCVPSRGIQKGIVLDVDDAATSIRESVDKARGASGTRVHRTVVGFSSKHLSSANPMVSVETDRRDHVVTEAALLHAERELQAIAFPEDRMKVNMVTRQYAVDNMGGIKNPLGMHGYRLDLEAHVVTADTTYVENLALSMRRAGLPVLSNCFVANPLACGQAVLEPEDRERGVMVADIGGGGTGLAVFKDGSIWHTSALPVGGRQVTNDLAVGLNIPFSRAEELKTSHGSVYPNEAAESIFSEYSSSADQVAYIIRSRMEEILRMIITKSPDVPGTLVLTGGGAKLAGLEQFAQELLGLKVRIGKPRALPVVGLDDPAYAAGVGLLFWGTGAAQIEENGNGANGGSDDLLQPFVSLLSGLRTGWITLWSRRPRIVFGPMAGPPED